MNDERSVLSRWSRRKAAVRAGVAVEEPTEAPRPAELPRAGALPATIPEAADAEPIDRDDALPADAEAASLPEPLPTLTELDDDSDYSAFLREKVPAAVRKQALRQLFSAAKFNIVDGLDDYDDDFRQILPLGDIVTSDMKHQIEVQAQRAKEKAEEEARKVALGKEEDADGATLGKEEDADGEETKALEVDEAPGDEPPIEQQPAAAPPVHRGLRRPGSSSGATGNASNNTVNNNDSRAPPDLTGAPDDGDTQ